MKSESEDHLDIYVPGVLRCLQCNFELTQATLFVGSGDIGLTREQAYCKSEPCPNDGSPMVKVRWAERAQQNYEAYGALMNEIIGIAGLSIQCDSLPQALSLLRCKMADSAQAEQEIANWQTTAEQLRAKLVTAEQEKSMSLTDIESKRGGSMERETQEGHQATIRGLRDTIGGMSKEPTGENFDRLAGCLEALAEVVGALLKTQGPSEHARAVADLARSHEIGELRKEEAPSRIGSKYPADGRD